MTLHCGTKVYFPVVPEAGLSDHALPPTTSMEDRLFKVLDMHLANERKSRKPRSFIPVCIRWRDDTGTRHVEQCLLANTITK